MHKPKPGPLLAYGFVLLLFMVFGNGSVFAACSSYLGSIVFNEVQLPNSGTTYLELRVLNPNIVAATNQFTGWTLGVNRKKVSNGALDTPLAVNLNSIVTNASLNTCGASSAWIQIPDSSIGSYIGSSRGTYDLNYVLYDDNGDMVDLLRIADSTMSSFYSGHGTQCPSIEPSTESTFNNRYDFKWGSGSSIKDWYRTTDGTGTWTGTNTSNNTNSICGSNDVAAAAQVGLNKVASTPTVTTNTNFTFTLFAQNPLSGAAQSNVLVTDNLTTPGLSFVSCTPTSPDTCVYSAATGTVTWTISSLPVSSVRSALLTVKATSTGTKTNTITASTSGTPTASTSVAVSNSVPTVTTEAASGITVSSATLNGTVNPNGADTTVSFGYSRYTGIYTSTCIPATTSYSGGTVQSFSCSLTDLACDTSYYFRAVGTNAVGTAAGSEMSFTTPVCASSGPAALNAVNVGANAVTGKITTKIAGSGFSLDVYALNAAKTSADYTANGDVLIDLLANTGTGVALDANNCPISATSISVGTFTLASGKATVPIPAIANSWRDVRVRMRYPATGSATVTACSADNFAVKPSSLGVVASHADWQTAGSTPTLANTSATGGEIHRAGKPFTLTATAYNAAAAVTANYTGTPAMTLSACTGTACTVSLGTFTPGVSSFTAGVLLSNTANYSDVGSFNLTLQDTAYASVDSADTAATCAGYYVCASAISIGRFVPDHFVISSPAVTHACASGATPFTYFGQDGFTTLFTITAQNAANATTSNYSTASSLAKLPLTTWAAAPAAAGLPGYGFAVSSWSPSQPGGASLAASSTSPSATNANTWVAGTTTVTAKHKIVRPPAPAVPTTVTITALPVDSDGVTMTAAEALGSVLLRFGRLRLSNAFGSVSPLDMPVEAQYWTGQSWVKNSDDTGASCTPVGALPSSYDVAGWPAPILPAALSSGSATIPLLPSSAGTRILMLDLAGVPWLRSKWGGTTYDENPSAKATFGIFNAEHKKTIHIRELY